MDETGEQTSAVGRWPVNRRDIIRTGVAKAAAASGLIPAIRGRAQEADEASTSDPSGVRAGADTVVPGPDGGLVVPKRTADGPITVFVAHKIVTMNPSNPEGTHVAVRDGRILGVGALADVAG